MTEKMEAENKGVQKKRTLGGKRNFVTLAHRKLKEKVRMVPTI